MKTKISDFLSYLDELYPDAHCELLYTKDYELLIAVMLSAQATDKSVNLVTPKLFTRYPTVEALANADLKDVQAIIRPLGMVNVKGKRIIEIAQKLVNEFNGKVPSDKEILTTFPGVGIKTANVVRAEFFKLPELAVDTHVERVSKRLKFANPEDNPAKVEQKLKKIVPIDRQIKTHHQMIFFGRYFCKALKPNCEECKMKATCRHYQSKNNQ